MHIFKRSFLLSIALLGVLCCKTLSDKEQAVERRELDAGGISVGTPKVYDDSVLQQLLNAAQTRLATLQLIDQTGISTRVGGLSGASQQFSSVALNVLGPPIPEITTTNNGATQTAVESSKIGSDGKVSGDITTTTTSGAALQNTVNKTLQINPNTGTAAPPATTLPSTGFGASASDILNEQLQLTYEIANLRLLLEGSLSDRLFQPRSGEKFVKQRVTIGFPISIAPTKHFRHAVAIVEAEVHTERCDDLSEGTQPPAITALLPREKTYNVAAITDRSTSIGAGVVTQMGSLGGSFLSGRRTYYIVKDQDTLAATFQSSPYDDQPSTGFSWQFRPVLGQEIVQSGLRQTFVQLAFATTESAAKYGQVHYRTYWRRYDPATGVLKGIIPGSLKDDYVDVPIPRFDMKQGIGAFSVRKNTEDLGNGNLLVRIDGKFLNGTSVRIGNTLLQAGSGLVADYNAIHFIASLNDLATKTAAIVTRDGTETPIIQKVEGISRKTPKILDTKLIALDETNSRLDVTVEVPPLRNLPPIVLVIGGRVFGYGDAPIQRVVNGNCLTTSVVLPTAFLAANRTVMVTSLLVDPDFFETARMIPVDAQPERLVLIEQPKTGNLRYLFYGTRLGTYGDQRSDITIIFPVGARFTMVEETGVDQEKIRFLALNPDQVNQSKLMVLQRPGERPFVVAIPTLVEPAKVTPKFTERVTVGADEALISGDGLEAVKTITILKHPLTDLEMEGKNLRVKGLVAAGITSTARTVECALKTSDGSKFANIQLEIVSSKVESISK